MGWQTARSRKKLRLGLLSAPDFVGLALSIRRELGWKERYGRDQCSSRSKGAAVGVESPATLQGSGLILSASRVGEVGIVACVVPMTSACCSFSRAIAGVSLARRANFLSSTRCQVSSYCRVFGGARAVRTWPQLAPRILPVAALNFIPLSVFAAPKRSPHYLSLVRFTRDWMPIVPQDALPTIDKCHCVGKPLRLT